MFISLLWLLVFIGGSLALTYNRVPLILSTLAYLLLLVVYSVAGDGSDIFKLTLWLVFAVIAVPLNTPSLRRAWISKPLLDVFRRIMPEMSQTEADALESGSVWWDGELFSGRPNWTRLLNTPAPKISTEEQAFLDTEVEELCAMLDEWKITHEWCDLPPEAWAYLKKKGFFAMIIPKRYGGREFSALMNSEVLAKIATRSATAASIVAVPNSLGPAELLLRYGTEQQKDHYLPRLASGEDVPCFALTAPNAGSDAAAIKDAGVVCKGMWEGKDILGMRLNWDKRYITLAPVATVLGLAFKLYDPEHLMGDQDEYGITCALIPPHLPGISIGRRHFPLNLPFQNGPTQGKDVFVPLDFIIGGPKMAGHGWRMLMECLGAGRAISLPSNTTGASRLGVYTTGAYARIRKQFRLAIARFDGVDEVLGRMGGTLYAMEAVRTMTAGAIDQGEAPAVCAAISKLHVTEMARHVGNDAMDVHGGKGIQLGPKNYLGRGYQSIPIAITVEGANILTRNLMIYGQGAIRSHPFVLKEMRAAADEDHHHALIEFDQALFGHMGLAFSNAARSLWMALTSARLTRVPVSTPTERYYQHINRFSASFVLASDAAMLTLGGALKKKEKLSARLGDMLSYLYIASAALKRFEDQNRPVEDLPLVEYACRDALYRFQESMHSFLRNFPNRPVAVLLRALIFPRGRSYSAPSDQLGHQIAELISMPGPARDRLTRNTYTGDAHSPVGIFAEALTLATKLEPVEHRIRDAEKQGKLRSGRGVSPVLAAEEAGLLKPDEVKDLLRLDELTAQIVAVDDFDPMDLGTRPFKKA